MYVQTTAAGNQEPTLGVTRLLRSVNLVDVLNRVEGVGVIPKVLKLVGGAGRRVTHVTLRFN